MNEKNYCVGQIKLLGFREHQEYYKLGPKEFRILNEVLSYKSIISSTTSIIPGVDRES